MNLNIADPNEAVLKRTHDGVNTYRNSSPVSTTHTSQSYASKKRAVANGSTPTKSPRVLSKGDKHLTGVPVEKKILDIDSQDRWNTSYQALRLEKEWTELHDRRSMKRNSEILRHRVDKMYMMSGSGIKLRAKYDINDDELQQLKDLSEARQVLRDKSRKSQIQSANLIEEGVSPFSHPPDTTPTHGDQSLETPDSGQGVSPRSDVGVMKQVPEAAILSRTKSKSPVYRADSPESGIQADEPREEDLQDNQLFELEEEPKDMEEELKDLEEEPKDLEEEPDSAGLVRVELRGIDAGSHGETSKEFDTSYIDRPISRVEIRHQHKAAPPPEQDVGIVDILKHQLSTNKDKCMLDMVTRSPNNDGIDDNLDDTPPARESSSHKIHITPGHGSYTILPFDPYDNIRKGKVTGSNYVHKGDCCQPLVKKKKINRQVLPIQQFPIRKPSSRFVVAQSPVTCNCRQSSYQMLSVQGYHVLLSKRVM
ncbi:uncharacterized protein LOC124278334 isoform X1 [Haliotis rubra]|uniref:uncharacterized protein LOC124278334 isoform X1 n=1 Tax=Haliotis rubra TaxID=36100 RepID=UPI001EE58999|nr:uncharacterized protein LOC124278334 isoform X1 [Haliotis rubra]